MKKLLICSVIFLGMQNFSYAAETSRIEMADGSVISAQVVSLENETYTLNAESLGTIQVPASKIKKIEANSASTATSNAPSAGSSEIPNLSDPNIQAQMQQIQADVLSNPKMMDIVQELANDPQFQAIMNDPQVMDAIKSGNIQALMANEKFIKLMNNSKVKEIGNTIQK